MTILEFPLSCSHANVDRSAQLFHRFCRLAVVINLFALVLILPLKPTCAEENSVATYTKLADGRIRVFLGGEFFAEYRSDFKGTPIVWPICAPGQTLATRSWPMIAEVDPTNEKDLTMREVYLNAVLSEKGGVKDHPHHRSLWFNHGDVNGGDFWGGTPATIRQAGDAVVETKGAVVTIITENLWNNDKIQEKKIVEDAIKEVGMEGYEDRSFLSLSGGEKQRTLVARALVQQANLIILDEPTNHLDIGYQYQIMNILKAQDLTVFSSIHDMNIAACYCDKIIMMKSGHIVKVGTPEEVMVPAMIKDLFGVDTKITENPVTGKPNVIFLPEIPEGIL